MQSHKTNFIPEKQPHIYFNLLLYNAVCQYIKTNYLKMCANFTQIFYSLVPLQIRNAGEQVHFDHEVEFHKTLIFKNMETTTS